MVQNSDGGWGETCGAMMIPTRAALVRARLRRRRGPLWDCWRRAIHVATPCSAAFLPAGNGTHGWTWDEDQYTGTGFPRVFYLAYHLYRDYFPLIALSTYARDFSAMYKEGSVG